MPAQFRQLDPTQTGYLESDPERMFRGFLGQQANQSNNFLDFWRRQYPQVYGRYQGQLAGQALNNQFPEMPFLEFMRNYNFGNEWSALAPWTKGFMRQPRGFWNIGQ